MLRIFCKNDALKEKMEKRQRNAHAGDCGVDLFTNEYSYSKDTFSKQVKINTGVHVAAYDEKGRPTGCLLYPRSSLSKTPYMLANSVGVIDAGYRGEVKAVLN